ncbi:hypothetical protein GLOTRDRAFT_134597 [Gloeophyllum trabeum ATCC 11539]|uniref:Uncharacterized protein n=1 Tax=Gloeophyllum trabeum (strain ATCC 11539 / FP-39264 / Madison 617) TaxID=670483 RepID=S7RBM3_GLOTA|nr:uncharacterized protein GLOTRDRAFT_134597 [Gloeophyllum trabeum ATCC 11539]EPQ49799.1 hypothetical protein GLOTRDRAFT_134597 [Gloeophyllum trabeum ATCC 11539]
MTLATARMIATLTAQLELPSAIVTSCDVSRGTRLIDFTASPSTRPFPVAPATTRPLRRRFLLRHLFRLLGKRAVVQNVLTRSRPRLRNPLRRILGLSPVVVVVPRVQAKSPTRRRRLRVEECAQKKTRCSFADEKGMQVESTGESEDMGEVVATGPQGSPKKPRLHLDSVTKVEVPPRPRPKGKGKATASADVPSATQGPSAAHSSNPPPVAPSPAVSLLELGPEVFPVSRTPSSDHSLLSLLPRADQSAEQISRLARSVVELREQSLTMRESSLRLREETAELRRGVDDVRRQQLELRGAIEEVREEIRQLRVEQGNVVMDLGLLRSHSQVSFRTLQEETQGLDRRLAVVEESLGLSERPPGTEGSPEVEEDAHGSTPGSSAS